MGDVSIKIISSRTKRELVEIKWRSRMSQFVALKNLLGQDQFGKWSEGEWSLTCTKMRGPELKSRKPSDRLRQPIDAEICPLMISDSLGVDFRMSKESEASVKKRPGVSAVPERRRTVEGRESTYIRSAKTCRYASTTGVPS